MKIQVNNQEKETTNTMEPVGVKVKDVNTQPEEVQVEEPVTEESTVEEPQTITEPIPTPTPFDFVNTESEVVDSEETEKEPVDPFKKIGTARLVTCDGTTIYRFDIFYREYAENSGTIEYRNIVNDFESARPEGKKDFKEFFAMFGIIRWNFPNSVLPVSTNVTLALNKIESLINEHIKIAGIKKGKFEFKVDIL